jgi:hypothetical protein
VCKLCCFAHFQHTPVTLTCARVPSPTLLYYSSQVNQLRLGRLQNRRSWVQVLLRPPQERRQRREKEPPASTGGFALARNTATLLPFSVRGSRGLQDQAGAAYGAARPLLLKEVRVDVERKARSRVPQAVRQHLRIHTLFDRDRSVQMPKVVQAHARNPSLFSQLVPDAREVARLHVCPDRRGKHQAQVRPRFAEKFALCLLPPAVVL